MSAHAFAGLLKVYDWYRSSNLSLYNFMCLSQTNTNSFLLQKACRIIDTSILTSWSFIRKFYYVNKLFSMFAFSPECSSVSTNEIHSYILMLLLLSYIFVLVHCKKEAE